MHFLFRPRHCLLHLWNIRRRNWRHHDLELLYRRLLEVSKQTLGPRLLLIAVLWWVASRVWRLVLLTNVKMRWHETASRQKRSLYLFKRGRSMGATPGTEDGPTQEKVINSQIARYWAVSRKLNEYPKYKGISQTSFLTNIYREQNHNLQELPFAQPEEKIVELRELIN